MIEITRKLARQLRTVFRRALGSGSRIAPAVVFCSGPDGLRIQSQGSSIAIEYHLPGDYPPERLVVPFELLADCEGRKDEPVTLEQGTKKRVVASWRDGSIPQVVYYETRSQTKESFPQLPPGMTSNKPRLLTSLRDAVDTTDQESTRYALGCVQLRGGGQVVATDGRQLLVQNGFSFPWEEDLLVPGSKVFACRELSHDEPIGIGATGDWVSIKAGPWTIHQRIEKSGRFPRTEDLIRKPQEAATHWRLSPGDAEFLIECLKRLPGDSSGHLSVTVDLNGQAAIRAKPENQPHPTELLLRDSQFSGKAIRYITDRHYLSRALRLGFHDVFLFDAESAVICHDEHRHYLWMPLAGDGAIGPSPDAIRIESPLDAQPTEMKPSPAKPKTRNTMPKTKPTSTNGKPKPTKIDDSTSSDALVEQAEALRGSLREAQANLGELIAGLKRHKRQAKSVHSALQSLRQLQTLEA